MLSRQIRVAVFAPLLLLVCASSHAALHSRAGGQAYYDDVLNITWVADANLNGPMTWAQAQAWIGTLNTANYLGVSDWRLPIILDTGSPGCAGASYTGTDCGYNVQTGSAATTVYSEMASLFYDTLGNTGYYDTSGTPTGCSSIKPYCLTNEGPFSNIQGDFFYWSGTQYAPDPTFYAWDFAFGTGQQGAKFKEHTERNWAWAVRPGDIGCALAASIDLTCGSTTGSLLLNQSFNGETLSADVTLLLGVHDQQVSSMTVTGVDIRNSSALVGARIYASSGTLIASAAVNVAVGEDQTITVPISSTLIAGNSYRLAFYVPSSTTGNNGDRFDPNPPGAGGFGYVESHGLFQVNGGFQSVGDVFPSTASSAIARISLVASDDTDADGVPDISDNCTLVPNGPLHPDAGGHSQLDADGDGYGNICDADLNQSGLVTTSDYTLLRNVLNTSDANADLNGSGLVTTSDYTILRNRLNTAPGPSGLHP